MIIWITGLPGSGKTTLGKNLKSILEPKISKSIVLLDGDNIRNILPYKISYKNEDRIKLAHFYSELALLIEQSNCLVICSFVALFHSIQKHIRLEADCYFEIFLDPPFNELAKKNKKGLFCKNSEYMTNQFNKHQFPTNPELKINSIIKGVYQDKSVQIAEEILKKLKTSS